MRSRSTQPAICGCPPGRPKPSRSPTPRHTLPLTCAKRATSVRDSGRLVGPQALNDSPLRAVNLVDLEADTRQIVQGIAQQVVSLEAHRERLEQPLNGPH